MERPRFEDIKTYGEFSEYYWYRAELSAICKSLGLEYLGDKAELERIIAAWFDGVKILHKPRKAVKATTKELTLDTPLIDCGFTFGQRFRDFYIAQTGDENFRFTADTVATARTVKANGDRSFTLGDLLEVKRGNKTYVAFDNSSCRWNKFLKDFCADPANGIYPDKLKTASKFWALLRESNEPKTYSRTFIDKNKDKI